MRLFYHFLNTDKPAEKKLLNDSDYCDFSKQVREKYFRSDFFRAFCARPEDFGIASGFISDVAFGVYRRWRKKPADDRPDLDTLADMTANMLMGGLKGLENHDIPLYNTDSADKFMGRCGNERP